MKWLLRGALTFVTLILLAVLVLVMVPTERVARLAADRIAAATGRAVTIEGPLRATLWPRIGVRAEGVAVANADWSTQGPMLHAESLEVGIALRSVLGGDIRIETLEVDGARLLLERQADGTGNWQVAGLAGPDAPVANPTAAAGPGETSRAVSIDRAVLRGADVTWIDRATGRSLHLRAVDFETRLDGLDAPVRFDGSALLGDLPLTVEASAGGLRPLLGGALTPVTVSLAAGGTTLGLDGRVDLDPLSFEGRVRARSDDRFALLSALGLGAPDLPLGLGAERVDIEAALTLAPAGTIHLRDMTAALDDNRLTGAVDVDPTGARPRIVATLSAEYLDFAPAPAPTAAGAGAAPPALAAASAGGWSRAPIDASGLFATDGEVTLVSGPVTYGSLRVEELRARATLDDGRAVITLQPLLAYGGAVTGDVVVNARGGLSTRADLEVSGLQLQPFLTAFAGIDRLVGTADLSVSLLGVGDTEQALMESLDGSVSLRAGKGEGLGLDVPGMVRTLDLGYRGEGQRTVFDGLSVSAAVASGVARSADLSLDARPYLTATGEGSVDLSARTVSYRLMPTVRAEADGAGLTVPIAIEGSWDDPRISPDLEYLARQRLDVERAQIEARAVDEVRQRLADELDVAPEALGSREAVEDAIRGRVEDKLLELLQGR